MTKVFNFEHFMMKLPVRVIWYPIWIVWTFYLHPIHIKGHRSKANISMAIKSQLQFFMTSLTSKLNLLNLVHVSSNIFQYEGFDENNGELLMYYHENQCPSVLSKVVQDFLIYFCFGENSKDRTKCSERQIEV